MKLNRSIIVLLLLNLLLQNLGAQVNTLKPSKDDQALCAAAKGKNYLSVKNLVDKGAFVNNLSCAEGQSPMHS